MSDAEFIEAEGFIHIINPAMAEFTLCGDAYDLASDVDGYEQSPTKSRTVDCAVCAQIILTCRGVRVASSVK